MLLPSYQKDWEAISLYLPKTQFMTARQVYQAMGRTLNMARLVLVLQVMETHKVVEVQRTEGYNVRNRYRQL